MTNLFMKRQACLNRNNDGLSLTGRASTEPCGKHSRTHGEQHNKKRMQMQPEHAWKHNRHTGIGSDGDGAEPNITQP